MFQECVDRGKGGGVTALEILGILENSESGGNPKSLSEPRIVSKLREEEMATDLRRKYSEEKSKNAGTYISS